MARKLGGERKMSQRQFENELKRIEKEQKTPGATAVYSVTLEVKIVVHAKSREDAVLTATEPNKIAERLQSIKVTDIFCPAEGR